MLPKGELWCACEWRGWGGGGGGGQMLIKSNRGNKPGQGQEATETRDVSNYCLEFFQKLSGKAARFPEILTMG